MVLNCTLFLQGMLLGCQASTVCCHEMSALTPALAYSGHPPPAMDTAVEQLSDMFPQQARSFLLDIYEQAGCDLGRAVECLQVVLGISRPASPARRHPDNLQETAEQLGLETGDSGLSKQQSANRAVYQHLSHCNDSRTSSPARQGSRHQPVIGYPDLFPPEVTHTSAHPPCAGNTSARYCSWIYDQPRSQLNVLAQSQKWWPKYGAKNLPFVPKLVEQHTRGCNAGDTASPPTKLLNPSTSEADGAAVGHFQNDGQELCGHMADLQVQSTTTNQAVQCSSLNGTAASPVSQLLQASPSASQTPEQMAHQCIPRQSTVQSWSEFDASTSGSPISASADSPFDDTPEDARQKEHELQVIFITLPQMIIANALRECQYDIAEASDKCMEYVGMANGVPEWSESSDADTSSVAADSLAEAQSPRHRWGCIPDWLDDAESLQVRSSTACLAAPLYHCLLCQVLCSAQLFLHCISFFYNAVLFCLPACSAALVCTACEAFYIGEATVT